MNTIKLTKKALNLFPRWINVDPLPDAVKILAAYAAQSPGLDPRDYDRSSYRIESRRISNDLAKVRESLAFLCACNVSDDLLIRASSGDRLTLNRRSDGSIEIDYTTGQYWPTEYRAAVARVLERACGQSTNGRV